MEEETTSLKKWYKSKTVLSGIVKIVGGVILSIAQLLSGELNQELFMTGIVSAIFGVNDIITRFNTKEAIK